MATANDCPDLDTCIRYSTVQYMNSIGVESSYTQESSLRTDTDPAAAGSAFACWQSPLESRKEAYCLGEIGEGPR